MPAPRSRTSTYQERPTEDKKFTWCHQVRQMEKLSVLLPRKERVGPRAMRAW